MFKPHHVLPTIAQNVHFQLVYFICGSLLFGTLLRFLPTPTTLAQVQYPTLSLEPKSGAKVCRRDSSAFCSSIETITRLLLHHQLNAPSLRHLTYVADGQSLSEEALAIWEVYETVLTKTCFFFFS